MQHDLINRSARSRPSMVAFVVLIAALATVGCGCRHEPVAVKPQPPKRSSADVPKKAAAPETVAQAETESKEGSGADQPPIQEVVPAKEGSSDTSRGNDVAVAAAPVTYGLERILVLLPDNPLIVELELTIDGQPHTRALDSLVEEVLKVADTDGNGRPNWSELTASQQFKYGQYGNLPIDGDNGPKQIVEKYDIDRDGIVDDTELPRFLTRNAGGARAFSVRGMIYESLASQRDAPTWRVLDADDDGNLSPEEIMAASARLRLRDTNDDEILVSAELRASAAAATAMDVRPRRRGGRDAVELLGAHARWDAVRSNLEEVYALGGGLEADDFPLTPNLFAALDEEADGRLKRKEFERLNDVQGHLRLAITFGRSDADRADGTNRDELPPQPRVRVVSVSDELKAEHSVSQLADDRLLLRIGGFPLLIYTNDLVPGGNFAPQAERSLAMFDKDKNGYLDASELDANAQATVGRLEATDTDGDGRVYVGEMISYLEQQQKALRSQIHARVEGRDDSLRIALDENDDGRIDSREIDAAPQRLKDLDQNADGTLDLDELPGGMVIAIARGSLESPETLFAMSATRRPDTSNEGPRWFQQMDANRDSSISLREFLGPVELFERLDANGDGFLDVSEATRDLEQSAQATATSRGTVGGEP